MLIYRGAERKLLMIVVAGEYINYRLKMLLVSSQGFCMHLHIVWK